MFNIIPGKRNKREHCREKRKGALPDKNVDFWAPGNRKLLKECIYSLMTNGIFSVYFCASWVIQKAVRLLEEFSILNATTLLSKFF
jgi:hypothetical protein